MRRLCRNSGCAPVNILAHTGAGINQRHEIGQTLQGLLSPHDEPPQSQGRFRV